MIETNTRARPDYVLTEADTVLLNDAGRAVAQAYAEAEQALVALRRCWAGACLAGLFRRNAWLQSARLTLTASAEYDDQGASCRIVSASVTRVLPVPGLALPSSLVQRGHFNDVGAIALVEDDLGDSDDDLYAAFRGEGIEYGELVLDFNRADLAQLLEGSQVSCAAAYLALCPPGRPDAAAI
jgi:hypothetical protein